MASDGKKNGKNMDDECEDTSFIATEHVSLTQELIQQQETAVREIKATMAMLGEPAITSSDDLLHNIAALKAAVKTMKEREESGEKVDPEEHIDLDDMDADLLDYENITDEREILEVKLKNSETVLDRTKKATETLSILLKENKKELSQIKCQKETSDIKLKLLEDQVEMLQKDLKNQNTGNSDNLNDAIEERNLAVKEKNEAWIELSVTKGELIQTNQQLLEVISQKVKLGQQLENWQIDMQNVLEEQIELKLTKNLGLTKF